MQEQHECPGNRGERLSEWHVLVVFERTQGSAAGQSSFDGLRTIQMTGVRPTAARLTPAESRGFADPPHDGVPWFEGCAQGSITHRHSGPRAIYPESTI